MELPDLPKKYKRIEANVDGPVLRWLVKNYPRSFALEVKIKDGGRVLRHQSVDLKKVTNGRFGHKIPDMGQRNPFDAFGLIGADALVCFVDGRKVECRVNDTHSISFTI
jgi:hypothetical protein